MFVSVALSFTLLFVSDGFRFVAKPNRISSLSMSTIERPLISNMPKMSPLNGKALNILEKNVPSLSEVKAIIPKDVFEKNTALSLAYAGLDLLITGACAFLGAKYILPMGFTSPKAIASWVGYAVVTGTAAIGMWVTAHECGHGAFSNNRKLQDFVGYLFHSALLVPYFSWQRSHAVHHANTNHVIDGETHVPVIKDFSGKAILNKFLGKSIGTFTWGVSQTLAHLLFGWPAYLLFGKTGGSSRGITNHFLPFPLTKPPNPSKELFASAKNKLGKIQ
jgi:hypothetical protein